jgi:predicted nucleotidyltransferase
LDSVVVKSVDVAAVRAAADRYAAGVLAARADVEEIVVFGSFENGSWAPGSDLDILIVLSAADRPVRDRMASLLPDRFPVPVDLFPFTRAELQARADAPITAAMAASRWRYRRTRDR